MSGIGVRTVGGAARRRPRLRIPALLLAALGVLVALATVLIVSPAARDRGDDFLHLFRTSRREPLAIIDVSLPQVPGVDPQAIADAFDIELPPGIDVASSHDAQDRVDFNVRTIRRQQAPRVTVFLDQPATIRIDRAALERAVAAVAPGLRLPRELDTPVVAQIAAGVREVWADPTGDITLWILRNPRFYTSSGPSWEELRDRLIQLAMLVAPERARELQSVSDWENTLVVPVPPGAATQRVRADSTDNALLIEQNGRSVLIWQRYGVVHLLDAHLPGRALVRLADSLR